MNWFTKRMRMGRAENRVRAWVMAGKNTEGLRLLVRYWGGQRVEEKVEGDGGR